MSNLSIVIAREYLQRVRRKSFIISTLLMPVLMLGIMAAPALVAAFSGPEEKVIAVIDPQFQVAQLLAASTDNTSSFVSNSSTHIPAMLHNIIENIDTAKNEVAILVSDMKYSPMGKTAAPELLQYQEQIRNVVGIHPNIPAFKYPVFLYLSKI